MGVKSNTELILTPDRVFDVSRAHIYNYIELTGNLTSPSPQMNIPNRFQMIHTAGKTIKQNKKATMRVVMYQDENISISKV